MKWGKKKPISSSSSPGFFSWLSGGSSSSLNSLDMPLQGVSLPPPLADLVEPSKLKITTLPNGLKIASEMSPVSKSYVYSLKIESFKMN